MRHGWMFPVAAAIAMTIMAVTTGDWSSWFGAGFIWSGTLTMTVEAYLRLPTSIRWNSPRQHA